MRILNRSSVWGRFMINMCVCVQDKTTRWCLSLQRKIIIGFFIIVFFLLLFTKSCEECMFKPFSCYILTVAWHLSNHPLVTVRKGCLQWLHSCIWSESNKTILDVKIPYLLTFNTQLLFQCRRASWRNSSKKQRYWPKMGLVLNLATVNSCSLTL